MKRIDMGISEMKHGTVASYKLGCKCGKCIYSMRIKRERKYKNRKKKLEQMNEVRGFRYRYQVEGI
jgi:hypothetical protein